MYLENVLDRLDQYLDNVYLINVFGQCVFGHFELLVYLDNVLDRLGQYLDNVFGQCVLNFP